MIFLHYVEDFFNKLVNKHHTTDVFELCELENIIYREFDMHPDINGIYQYVYDVKIITINKNLCKKDRRITCQHELGHAVMHETYNCTYLKTKTYINLNKIEREADTFSSLFEIPILTEEMLKNKTLPQVAYELDVPIELLILRLNICSFKNIL